MYTALLTVENIFGARHDVWTVNVEEEYHEQGSTGRDAPVLPRREPTGATATANAGAPAPAGAGTGTRTGTLDPG